jgi:anti-anti-sigma regulatory factor
MSAAKEKTMRVIEHRYGDIALLEVDGALTVPDAGDLLEPAASRLAGDGPRVIIASLQNVSAIDAGGLGAMVAHIERVFACGSRSASSTCRGACST